MIRSIFIFLILFFAQLPLYSQSEKPKYYPCLRTTGRLEIDGVLDEPAWADAPWTADFVDIEGDKRPKPLYRTRAKMLWDDQYFYIAAALEEPQLWATYDQRDMVIFHENDFEVFIDPDGDTHQYYELEINALGTVWDLLLVKPYRDGGPAIDAWDIRELKKGVQLDGTLNDPADTDNGWTVELALPWSVLEEAAREGEKPVPGDVWRVNFSRVNWRIEGNGSGQYEKQLNPDTGQPWPEYNWVWSPQGVIAMHRPETWGYVHFVDRVGQVQPIEGYEELMLLRACYYAQKEYKEKKGCYATDIALLGIEKPAQAVMSVDTTPSFFEVVLSIEGTDWHIDSDGRTWKTIKNK